MAAGKSTVAQSLAERLSPSVHLRGDIFRKMVVNGRADMSPVPSTEALAQLSLRYRLARDAAVTYSGAGFNVVYQDVILGPLLSDVVASFADYELALVVLNPSLSSVAKRDRERPTNVYGPEWTPELLGSVLDATARLGLWLDTSNDDVSATVDRILARVTEATLKPRAS
jgi:chloramphenicol 3-O-phosphotransferase